MNGQFVFSDDSHGINQIGHSYEGLLAHAKHVGIPAITVFRRVQLTKDTRFPGIGTEDVLIQDVECHEFWGVIAQ